MDHTFVVFGATGNVGRELAGSLATQGHRVVAPVRDTSAIRATSIEARPFELRQGGDFASLLDGVTGVFMLAGFRRALESICRAIPTTARLVLLSAAVAELGQRNELSGLHAQAEDQVQAVTDNWTILRPQAFASNALRWVPQLRAGNSISVQFPDLSAALVAPRDIAAVASAALASSEHRRRTYRLSGPTPLLPSEQVQALGRALGRDLRPVDLSDDQTRAAMLQGSPSPIVDSLFDLYRVAGYEESVVTPDIERVLGRPATSFEHWAAENRHRF